MLNALDYGVIGNGTVDDTDALNDFWINTPPGAVLEASGLTCLVSRPLVFPGGHTYVNHGTTFLQADGANIDGPMIQACSWVCDFDYGDHPLKWFGGTVDANRYGNPGATTDGICFRSWKSTVRDLAVERASGRGIVYSGPSLNGTEIKAGQSLVETYFEDCHVSDTISHALHVTDPGTQQLTDGHVDNLTVFGAVAAEPDSAGCGIFVEPGAGWTVAQCHIYGVGGDGIKLNGCYGSKVVNNYLDSWGRTAREGATGNGISMAGIEGRASLVSGNDIAMLDKYLRAGHTYNALLWQNVTAGRTRLTLGANTATLEGTVPAGVTAARAWRITNQKPEGHTVYSVSDGLLDDGWLTPGVSTNSTGGFEHRVGRHRRRGCWPFFRR